MRLAIAALVILLVILFLFNQPPAADTYAGFRLPEGDILAGQKAFGELGCTTCHSVPGTDLPAPAADAPIHIKLGGTVTQAKAYGMLLTAIMHPSHGLPHDARPAYLDASGEPLDLNLTDRMSVRQLIDIVEFLQDHYAFEPPPYPGFYRGYHELSPEVSPPLVP
jgi:hypothetical protein